MAFGESGQSNYVRIQGNGFIPCKSKSANELSSITEEMLAQRNVESILFKGKKRSEVTNLEKLEKIGNELIKEQERRKTSILPAVVLKQMQLNGSSTSPRTSSATSISTQSSCWAFPNYIFTIFWYRMLDSYFQWLEFKSR